MGLFTVLSGAMVTVALLSFIDGMISLDSFPFPIIVPFLLSFLGFMMVSFVDPFMLSSTSDGLGLSSSSSIMMMGSSSSDDPYIQIRQRASFVLGVMLLLISTSISLTLNGFENESTGCAKDGVASSWPGFSLVFQGWCWLAAATFLYLDKCIVARGGRGGIGSILNPDSIQ